MVTIGFLEYVKLLAKYRKLLIFNVIIIAFVAIVASLVWPKKYKATASFIPSFDVSTPFSELRSAETPDLAVLLEGNVMVVSDIYVAVMKSRTIMEEVIDRTRIQSVFKLKTIEETIEVLEKNSSIETGGEQIITLTIYMPDPILAANVTNIWLDCLDSLSQSLIRDQGHREMIFIGNRLNSLKKELNDAIDTLAAFESRYRIFSLPEESKAAINVYAKLTEELLQKEIELMKWKSMGSNIAVGRALKSEIENIRKKLRELENNCHAGIVAKVPLSKLPWLQYNHEKLDREKTVLLSLYNYLLVEYEIASLKAQTNIPTIVVIDEAVPPEKRAWPSRAKIVVFSTFIAIIFNMMLVLTLENVKLRWRL